jgi:riboflavin synthase alpha subunit
MQQHRLKVSVHNSHTCQHIQQTHLRNIHMQTAVRTESLRHLGSSTALSSACITLRSAQDDEGDHENDVVMTESLQHTAILL